MRVGMTMVARPRRDDLGNCAARSVLAALRLGKPGWAAAQCLAYPRRERDRSFSIAHESGVCEIVVYRRRVSVEHSSGRWRQVQRKTLSIVMIALVCQVSHSGMNLSAYFSPQVQRDGAQAH